MIPRALRPGGFGTPGWRFEAGRDGAHQHRQGCPEELTTHPVPWLGPASCPPAWVTFHGGSPVGTRVRQPGPGPLYSCTAPPLPHSDILSPAPQRMKGQAALA